MIFVYNCFLISLFFGAFSLKEKNSINFSDFDEVPGFTAAWNETEAVLTEANIPGLVLTIVQGNGNSYKVWSKTHGVPDITKPNIPVSFTNHRFAIGSISKSFSATLLGILLTENMELYPLGFDTRMKDIMEESIYLRSSIENVTLKDLLSHTTGTYGYTSFIAAGLEVKPTKEYCRRMQHLRGSTSHTGLFYYNNLMYVLIECIIETIGNDSFSNLIKTKIFDPLGMVNTTLIENTDVSNIEIVPRMYYKDYSNSLLHELDINLLHMTDTLSAAGGILSTGSDMTRWIMFNLEEGMALSGKQLLCRELWMELHAKHVVVMHSTSFQEEYTYGMGWFRKLYRNVSISEHSGGLSGFDSKLTLALEEKFGIFTSANGPAYNSYPFLGPIHELIFDVFHNKTPQHSWPDIKPTIHEDTSNLTCMVEDSSPYTGTYGHSFFGNITVYSNSSDGSDLKFSFGLFGKGCLNLYDGIFQTRMEGPLSHYHVTYIHKEYISEVLFLEKDSGGKYEKLIFLHHEGATTFIRDFIYDEMTSEKSEENN